MNKIDVQQTGGFPLETDTLNALQTAYSLFNALGELAGDLAIISGCKTTGSTVSDGVVYINGEVFAFKGGTKSSSVILKEDTDSRVFEDGQSKMVYKTRYATFGSASQKYPWASFKHIKSVLALDSEKENKTVVGDLASQVAQKAEKSIVLNLSKTVESLVPKAVPKGAIIMWSGKITDIPSGWALCDGSNGTPDLSGRFIAGYKANDEDFNSIGKTGGSKNTTPSGYVSYESVRIQISPYGWGIEGDGPGRITQGRLIVGSGQYESREYLESLRGANSSGKSVSASHRHTFTGNSIEIIPPYYTLAYIIFKG